MTIKMSKDQIERFKKTGSANKKPTKKPAPKPKKGK